MKAKEPRAARANETKKIHQVFRPKLIQIRYVYLNTCFGYRSYIYIWIMVSLNSIDNCLKCCFSRISLLAYLWQFAIPVKYISANTTFPTLLWMNRCHPYRNTPSRRRFHTRKLCWCSEITGKTRVAITPILT